MRFDGFVGGLSFLELILMHNFQFSESGSSSFSVLRSLRLFRIFKMAKRWKSLQLLIRTIVASIYEIGNFAALLFLFILIYSLIGMQLLANRLHFSGENGTVISITDRHSWESAFIPRSNFDNFYSSMVTVFQILSGENWNVVLYDCWRARGWVSVVFIISLIVVGVFIVMNLFLAILLKNFEESGTFVDQEKLENVLEVKRTKELNPNPEIKRPSKIQILWAKIGKDNPIRKFCLMVAQSSKFDLLITLLIILSNFCLAVDNPLSDPETILARVLNICDIAFTCLFSAEMVIKILAYGLISETNAYLRDTWNILDCAVLLVSIFNISGVGPGSSLKSLRALRVLRTLRMINRFPELKVVVDALLLSLPSVADVAVLCAVFFLIFASFGVNFLKGTFYHCTGTNFENLTDEKLNYLMNPFEWSNLTNEQKAWFDTDAPGCGASTWTADTVPKSKDICDCLAPGGWSLVVPQNFDNVLNGMALLFEISTTEGWIEVMYAATDQRGIGMQPIKNHNPVWAFFLSYS
jgi:Na+-transporting methylmalonyl-CoA/oxaloacetate decarboxylase gamma subunit